MVEGKTLPSLDKTFADRYPVAMIFTYLYRPRDWPTLAGHLASALAGNGTSIVEIFLDKIEMNTTVPVSTSAAIYAVTCVDNPDFSDFTEEEAFEDLLHEMVLSQQMTSRHFTLDIDLCHHWKARETERFTGPFNHTLSNEILVIGNTADVRNVRSESWCSLTVVF